MTNKYIFRIINNIQKSDFMPVGIRVYLLKLAGIKFASKPSILCDVDFVNGNISIGSRCFINRGAFLEAEGGIIVGDDVQIGCGVKIITSTHDIGPPTRRAGESRTQPVKIGAGCWIGAGAIILPGTDLGSGCVVAAGSVLKGRTESDQLLAGVPAISKGVVTAATKSAEL